MKTSMICAVSVLTVVAFTWSAGLVPAPAVQPPAEAPELPASIRALVKPIEVAPGDSELQKKLKERHNSAVRLFEERVKDYKSGVRDITPVLEAARFVVEAKIEFAANAGERIAVLEQTLGLANFIEKRLQEHLDRGFGSRSDLERARYARLSVEVELLKAKQK